MPRISPLRSRIEEILLLKSRGLRGDQIAVQLGVSYRAFHAFCIRRQIRFPKTIPKKVNEAEMLRLIASGLTQPETAARLGVSRSAIERQSRRLGLKTWRTGPRHGAGHPEWNGGRTLQKYGYVGIWAPLHPQANAGTGSVPEHRFVMEVVLGRLLDRREVVDHLDDIPYHNWPDNLLLHACNADHLRRELTGRGWATSPRKSTAGAYGSTEKLARCPDESETLALCPAEIRARLVWYIESFRPTIAHQRLARRTFLRQGAWRDPFQAVSTASGSDSPL